MTYYIVGVICLKGDILITSINSTSNRLVKEVKQLKNKSKRYETGLYIAEGENVVLEAVLNKPDEIESIFVTEKFIDMINPSDFKVYLIPDYIMEGISDTKSPQGILAVMKMTQNSFLPDISDIAVYLDNVSDPGNIGTIIRTADAVGISTVILSPECADVYSPKIIRATMGSCFHINIVKEDTYLQYLNMLTDNGFRAVAGSLQATESHFDADLKSKVVICLGNEAHGLSEKLMSIKNVYPVKIPIIGKAESLNVSVAGAVLMYEVLRQRGISNE